MEADRDDQRFFVAHGFVEGFHLAVIAVDPVREIVGLLAQKLEHRVRRRIDVEGDRFTVYRQERGDRRMLAGRLTAAMIWVEIKAAFARALSAAFN